MGTNRVQEYYYKTQNTIMGQNAHSKYKEYKNEERNLRDSSSERDRLKVENLRLQYELQEKKDDEDLERGHKLFDRYGGF